ncbi:xyloglucan galactosyltransferase KATAMARI [Salix suchowensis]|nr:xyloglucan galactosyltransferase KATAMARI [Salix suchowensis]
MERLAIIRNWFVFLVAFSFFMVFFKAFDYSALSAGGTNSGAASLINNFVNNPHTHKPNHSLDVSQMFNQTASPDPSVDIDNPLTDHDRANNLTVNKNTTLAARTKRSSDSCKGRYIYVHHLPRRFNDDVLRNCSVLEKWLDMCPFLTNLGFGPQAENSEGVLSEKSWFTTNQFLLEVIFHERMKKYKCLTNNSSFADAIYVPFYAGLDVGRYLWGYNISMRDSLGSDLVKWLAQQPEWKPMRGRDHFFVSGRISWDFRRQTDSDSDWGSRLMNLPESMNLTTLSIETTSWSNEFAIPYPTYFHPSSDNEALLFAFAGAPRPSANDSIRMEIIHQCLASRRTCNFLRCNSGGASRCDNPAEVIKVFQDSVFCLQPPGDSYTRRSIFDSILAGCIPVFFHPFSATYSVFIPIDLVKDGFVSIKQVLLQISENEMLSMREEVIKLIPKVIYADPRSKLQTLEDAFDIALKGVLHRIGKVRNNMKKGRDPSNGFAEENSWKKKLSGIGVEEEWDHFIDTSMRY